MLIDSHAYCFPSLHGYGGFSNHETFLRHIQQAIAVHFQPSIRFSDLSVADSSGLIEMDHSDRLDSIKDSNFRVSSHGRFEWDVQGISYFKQYFPPSIVDMVYPPENLVSEMDYAGVDMALLHRTPYLGIGNEFIGDCVQKHPDRLKGLAHIEEWLIQKDPSGAIDKLTHAVESLGLSGVQFLPPQLNLYGQKGPWNGSGFRAYWDAVRDLGIPVFFSIKQRVEPQIQSYLKEIKTLIHWMERYPEVDVVVTHGLNWRMFVEGDAIVLPRIVWEVFKNPRAHLQFLFPIGLGSIWEYPMTEVKAVIEECVTKIGADRLMWGTDMPIVMRSWTYEQNVRFMQKSCDFLSDDERDMIMGGTIGQILKI